MLSKHVRTGRSPLLASRALALAALVLPGTASARDGAWYVGGDFGALIVEDAELGFELEVSGDTGTVDTRFDTGFDSAAFVGYDLGAFRLEAEIAYKEAGLDSYDSTIALPGGSAPGESDVVGGSTSALSFMLNGLLELGDDDGLSGFFGGGGGMARIHYNRLRNFDDETEAFLDDSDNRFAWQVVAGLRKSLSPNVDVHLRYRFFNVEDFRLEGFDDHQVTGRLGSDSVLAGITYNFGAPAPERPGGIDGPDESILDATDPSPYGPLGPALQGAIGFGTSQLPPTNYGFNRDGPSPGPELPAAFGNERIGMLIVDAAVRARNFGRFSLRYAEGEASNRTEVPVSTTGGAQGTVNIRPSPGGSTGGTANRGLDVATETRLSEYGGSYRINIFEPEPVPRSEELGYPYGPIRVSAGYVEASADHRDREHVGTIDIPGVPAGSAPVIHQVLDQDVDELELGLAAGAELDIPLGSGAALTFDVEAGVEYYDYDVSTLQTNTQLVGGTNDRSFTLEDEDGKSGIKYHGDAIAELSVRATGSLELFAQGRASYHSERAQVINPFSGDFVLDGGTVELGTDDATDFAVIFGVRVRLGD